MELADLHMHSTYSDGTDTPGQLLEKLREKGIRTFALTDHDTLAGVAEMGRLTLSGERFIPGVELSCQTKLRKCHILGYRYDPLNADLREAASR